MSSYGYYAAYRDQLRFALKLEANGREARIEPNIVQPAYLAAWWKTMEHYAAKANEEAARGDR